MNAASSWHSNSAAIQIRINVLCSGAIATRHREDVEVPVVWPEGRPFHERRARQSCHAADAIHFLLSASARHITGSPLFIDGGQGLLR